MNKNLIITGRCLSIKEPYATMIFKGKKTIETRTWKTAYRGIIFLHASKYPKSKISGKLFAIAELVDCRRMVTGDIERACCEWYLSYSWILGNIIPFPTPIEMKGKLGLSKIRMILHAV